MQEKAKADFNAVEKVASYAANLRFEDLDEATIQKGQRIVLDTLGCALKGRQTPLGRRIADFVVLKEFGNEATVHGDGRRSSLEGAAWANANLAKRSIDDVHRVCGHIAAQVVPTALVVGEHKRVDGKTLIKAIAAGYEVTGAIQPVVKAWQRARGLDPKAHVGSMACAVTAAMPMGLSEKQIGSALGLAMDMAAGTEQYVYDGPLADHLLSGHGARNGVYAAKLADFGFRGPPGALDGGWGYFISYGDGYDPQYLANIGNLGILAGTAYKWHAGCRQIHSTADAALHLVSKGQPRVEDIASIEVGTYKNAMTPAFRVNADPKNWNEAAFSIPVTVSLILTRGSLQKEDIEAFDSPERRRLWPLTRVYLDEEIQAEYPQKNGTVVRVTTTDGRQYEGRVSYPKGEPENPLSDTDLEYKFRRQVGSLLTEARCQQIFETCYRLEELDDVSELVRLAIPEEIP